MSFDNNPGLNSDRDRRAEKYAQEARVDAARREAGNLSLLQRFRDRLTRRNRDEPPTGGRTPPPAKWS